MRINDQIVIDETELTEAFVRAGGPGGQNVNKVSSAVQLRFDVAATAALSEPVKARLLKIAGRRATSEGVLVIEAREFRDQPRNRIAARERLKALILQALERPKPRIATRPTLASKRRRIEGKKQRAAVKAGRRPPPSE